MLDVSISYNRYKFLGHEFLTWLWFAMEKDQQRIEGLEQEPVSLRIGNRMVLENRKGDALESVTIKGDDAGLEEGLLALRKGAVVTEMNLLYEAGDNQWQFTIRGESLHLVSFKCPQIGAVETEEDVEGAVLEKAYLYEKAIQLTDKLFKEFIALRVSDEWNKKVVPRVRKWIHS
jgi:hypothetical protein